MLYGASASADSFHIRNSDVKNIIKATVTVVGEQPHSFMMQPGDDYTYTPKHDQTVNFKITNPKTNKTICSLEVQERKYAWPSGSNPQSTWSAGSNYQPKVIPHGASDCLYFSSFAQVNWERDYPDRGFGPDYSWITIGTTEPPSMK